MKRKSIVIVFLMSVSIIASWGCGGGPGSPGSVNTEDTGVTLEATLVPTYLGNNSYSVDVVQQICQAGPPPEFEKFTDHNTTATITARLLNPNAQIPAGILYIEKYTVEFRRSSDSIGAPPIESDTRYTSIAVTPPTGSDVATVTATLILVDLTRKGKYLTDMTSGRFTSGMALINNYTALYTFEGKNSYGNSFSFKAQTDFQIGSFDYCS
jgi:hypothetical protein